MRTEEKKIWLTFDDGPIPGVTPWVLDVLDEYDAKATFFCVGENVVKHEKIFHSIIEKGHAVANHSYHHLNGWRTSNEIYFEDVERCNGLLRSKLFRPPYGKLRPSQYMNLGEKYSIVMWDVLTGDFDTKITREKCLENALQYSRPGSIVLFHDSLKARERMQYALPKFLEHFKKDGFSFERLESGVA